MAWFKDKRMLQISQEHDEALLREDIKKIEELVIISSNYAEDHQLHMMIRAKHYYNAATSVDGLIRLKQAKGRELEYYLEQTLFLYRKSIELQENYLDRLLEETKNFSLEERGNFLAIYYSAIVNDSIVLSFLGRIPAAIASSLKSATKGFGMAIGNLGGYLKHYGDVEYDDGHRMIHYIEALKLLKTAVESTDKNVYEEAKEYFKKDIGTILSLVENLNDEDVQVSTSLLFETVDKIAWDDLTISEEKRYAN